MRLTPSPHLALAALLALSAGCMDDAAGPAAPADALAPADTFVTPTPDVAVTPPDDPAFAAGLAAALAESAALTKEAFFAHYLDGIPTAPASLGYDALAATYLDLIDDAHALTDAEKEKLALNGFVVTERLRYDTFGEALLQVYAQDLPVLVTTDMILHALHRSYDNLLKFIEERVLIATLGDVLAKTHAHLGASPAPSTPEALAARADADFLLTVARSLLAGSPVASTGGAATNAARDAFLAHIAGEQLEEVQIFGVPRVMDFSQFKPRGHYTDSVELTRYFQAMMWLGRVDLRFVEQDPLTGAWRFQGRQLAAALLLDGSLRAAGALAGWDRANDLITMLVGPVDYIDFRGVARLATDHALAGADAAASLSGPAAAALVADLLGGKYGEQRINSHWLETNPFSSEPTPLPPSFAFLGQRFVVDSYVMSNVVYDRIVHDGQKVQRVLPSPFDVLFALGNDQVLPLLSDELDRYPYQGALHSVRFLIDFYDSSFWTANIYNLWLSALRTLNPPTREAPYPAAMRTDAWRDKTAHTQLASWAQLRHDTLLYAKQSYTGGVSCEHPAGYVEPYPAFYAALAQMADVAGQSLANADFGEAWGHDYVIAFFANWKDRMTTLAAIAQKELDGVPFTDADVAFLKGTIMAESGCGGPMYSGWYPALFFSMGEDLGVGEYKPTIADVHTNPNMGPLPGPNVLHVATADVEMMIFTAETCTGAEAFIGPVMTYYEVDPGQILRYSDQDWEKMLEDGTAPARPAFTASFRAPAP